MEEKTDTTKTTRSKIYAARLSPSEKSQLQQLAEAVDTWDSVSKGPSNTIIPKQS